MILSNLMEDNKKSPKYTKKLTADPDGLQIKMT